MKSKLWFAGKPLALSASLQGLVDKARRTASLFEAYMSFDEYVY
jgi:hypothetical protein